MAAAVQQEVVPLAPSLYYTMPTPVIQDMIKCSSPLLSITVAPNEKEWEEEKERRTEQDRM